MPLPPQGGKDICAAGDILVLCNWYGLPIAARSLGEFQEASEAPVSVAILAERATPKFAQRTAARRVELKTIGQPYQLHNTSESVETRSCQPTRRACMRE